MAGDLIPPPSPAGRPEPEGLRAGDEAPPSHGGADGASDSPALGDPAGAEELVLATRPDEGTADGVGGVVSVGVSPYRSRFGFVLGALIGIGIAATAVTALIVAGGGTTAGDGTRWSQWRPSSEDTFLAAEEIATHVGRKYRLGNGSQLVAVTSGPVALRDIPLRVVVRTAAVGGDIVPVDGTGVQYTLNGLGPRGSIKGGTPSAERLALLKREALELALYTFHYIDDVDHVVTLLPPPPTTPKSSSSSDASSSGTSSTSTDAEEQPPMTAMLFRPGDLRSQLEAPLELTIPPETPRPENLSARDAGLISEFTSGNIFNATVQQGQDATAFLVLERPQSLVGGLPEASDE